MTRLLIDPAADFDDPGAVTITATLLDPGPSIVRTFTDVTTDTVVDLPAPDTTEAWRLTIRRPVTTINRWNIPSTNPGPIVEERTVHFPDGNPISWAALTDVDPGTLRTTAVPSAAWDAAIAELRAEVDNLPTGGGGGGFSGAYADLTGAPAIPATPVDIGADPVGAATTAQAFAIQRANHIGTQSADTITDGTTAKSFLTTERAKLAGIADGATANRADTATDAAISTAVAGIVNAAPATLDTLGELATALQADEGTAATLAALVGTKAPLASPAFTGTPTIGGTAVAKTSDVTAAITAQATTDAGTYATKTAAAPRAAMFGWVTPRKATLDTATSAPTVTWQGWPFYGNDLAYDSAIVAHPAGRYATNNWFGINGLVNAANAPDLPEVMESFAEYATTAAEHAVNLWHPGGGIARLIINGQEVPFTMPDPGHVYAQLVFPTAVARTIRFEFYNVYWAGINYPTGAEIYTIPTRKIQAVMLGDSWVGGAAGVPWDQLHPIQIGRSLGWDVSRMGQGGSGYVTDNPDSKSQPFTDPTRLQAVADQAPDYAIIQGSINDPADPAAVGAAAATVYSTLAASTPRTKLVVIGVQPTGPAPLAADDTARRAANTAALRAAAAAAPNVVRFHDPIGEGWMVGQPDSVWAGDNAHLSASGHAVWTQRLVQALVAP